MFKKLLRKLCKLLGIIEDDSNYATVKDDTTALPQDSIEIDTNNETDIQTTDEVEEIDIEEVINEDIDTNKEEIPILPPVSEAKLEKIKQIEDILNTLNTSLDVINFEIKNWNLKPTYFGCECLRIIPTIIDRLDINMSFKDICEEISKETDQTALTVCSAISFIKSKAELDNSFIFTMFGKLGQEKLSNSYFIHEIVDLCKKIEATSKE